MTRRWEDDERGHGVSDAVQLLPGARELVAAFSQSNWVAEQPEIRLRPHVEAWGQHDERLALIGDNTDDTDAYILDLEWAARTAARGKRGLRSLAVVAPQVRERDAAIRAAPREPRESCDRVATRYSLLSRAEPRRRQLPDPLVDPDLDSVASLVSDRLPRCRLDRQPVRTVAGRTWACINFATERPSGEQELRSHAPVETRFCLRGDGPSCWLCPTAAVVC